MRINDTPEHLQKTSDSSSQSDSSSSDCDSVQDARQRPTARQTAKLPTGPRTKAVVPVSICVDSSSDNDNVLTWSVSEQWCPEAQAGHTVRDDSGGEHKAVTEAAQVENKSKDKQLAQPSVVHHPTAATSNAGVDTKNDNAGGGLAGGGGNQFSADSEVTLLTGRLLLIMIDS